MTETEKTGLCMEGREPSGNTGEVEKDPWAVIYKSVAAVAKAITEACAELSESLAVAAAELGELIRVIIRKGARMCSNFFDIILYSANDNPKWWHLYKHAKKARVRKKYRNLLLRQYYNKINDRRT